MRNVLCRRWAVLHAVPSSFGAETWNHSSAASRHAAAEAPTVWTLARGSGQILPLIFKPSTNPVVCLNVYPAPQRNWAGCYLLGCAARVGICYYSPLWIFYRRAKYIYKQIWALFGGAGGALLIWLRPEPQRAKCSMCCVGGGGFVRNLCSMNSSWTYLCWLQPFLLSIISCYYEAALFIMLSFNSDVWAFFYF